MISFQLITNAVAGTTIGKHNTRVKSDTYFNLISNFFKLNELNNTRDGWNYVFDLCLVMRHIMIKQNYTTINFHQSFLFDLFS